MVQQWTILRLRRFQRVPPHLAESLPFTSMLPCAYRARQHGRKAAPTTASARTDHAPAATRGEMTIPEKCTRSSGAVVASWRDVSSEDRENSVRKGIALRLKSICKELSIVEFQALVAKMTSEQLRGERTHCSIPRT